MDLTARARDHLLATTALFLFVATLTAVSALGAAVWLVLAAFGSSAASTLGTALPLFVAGVVVGVPLSAVSLVGVAYGVAARVSAAASDLADDWRAALARGAAAAEREHLLARLVGLSSLVSAVDSRSPEQRVEDRVEHLKDRYVAGDISEVELERSIRTVLVEEGVDRVAVSPLDDALATEASAGSTEDGERAT